MLRTRQSKATLWAVGLLAVTSLVSCEDPVRVLPHSWAEAGRSFSYDYIPGDPAAYAALPEAHRLPATSGALRMQIVDFFGPRVEWHYPKWTTIPGALAPDVMTSTMNLSRHTDGLHRRTSIGCGFGAIFTFDALRVPAKPQVGQQVKEYFCADTVYRVLTVVADQQQLNTPAGTLDVFVVEDDMGHGREYWNEEHGLIRIDRWDHEGRLVGYYVLAE